MTSGLLHVVDVFARGPRSYDNIIKKHEREVRLSRGWHDINQAFESPGCILDQMAFEWIVILGEGMRKQFIVVYLGNFHLQVAGTTVQGREYHSIPRRVNTFVHARYGVLIPHGYGVRLASSYAESERSIFCSCIHEGGHLFGLSQLD